jgi:hypothetical protein
MGALTHKRNNNNRRVTRRVQRGGDGVEPTDMRSDAEKALAAEKAAAFLRNSGPSDADRAASAAAFAKGQTPAALAAKEAEIEKMPETGLGVLISVKSLRSKNQKIRGTPYVIIVPQKNGSSQYAYGSTADNAVKAAKNQQWDKTGREKDDTYTGTMISKKALISTNPTYRNNPYIITVPSETPGKSDVWYGTTPANAVAKAAKTNASAVLGRFGSSVKGLAGRFSSKKAPAAGAAPAAPAAPVAPAVAKP